MYTADTHRIELQVKTGSSPGFPFTEGNIPSKSPTPSGCQSQSQALLSEPRPDFMTTGYVKASGIRRGSDDCAVPRATKFESAGRACLNPAPRAPRSRSGIQRTGSRTLWSIMIWEE
ncbi:Hypothetical predicted protein [Marmota monax]|uniref:Uncharacterized protein n=1 Tax=Marmota monax TaxID=9995 RepID=A0A5E4AYI2_MARMO|nr:Hypothetical predicted protein [Marmota monax]